MTARNKELVVHFYEELFRHGNLAVIDESVGTEYIDHNPKSTDGPAALRNVVTGIRAMHPKMHLTIERAIAEDDLVLLHTNAVLEPGTPSHAIVSVFRVRDDKIVEHWEVMQQVPARTASGNDMFGTLSAPRRQSPDPGVSTAASKQIAWALFQEVTADRDLTAFDRYAADPYYQHTPQAPNGTAAAKDQFACGFAASPELSISVKRVIAEGDYVAFHHHLQLTPDDLGSAVVDIFRVRDGRVVEHWDVTAPVPATSKNDNTVF
ncbi:ester cyclase [Streptomyces griseorubiginosus]|uniref:nuclear transport factor 2 family protein n=1 Tax=Streptomyces griseorubiginosus TaxID=67304 RepID=UPI003675B9BB